MENITINTDRLIETLKISNKVGQICETGIRRIALSKEDKIMRDIFKGWLREEGLTVRVDDFGNIYGRRKGRKDNLSPVTVGSHLDTQPYGGRYDGIIGVLSGLEIIKVLNEKKIQTERPIELINFTNEEGESFDPPGSGSGGLSNNFSEEYIHGSINKKEENFKEELKKINYLGEKENRLKEIHSYVELHIEQGSILQEEGKSIGIVQGDKGHEILELTIFGLTDHPLSTPMRKRKDAFIKATEIIVASQHILKEDEESIISVGGLDISPKAKGHIPDKVELTLLVSHESKQKRDQLIKRIEEIAIGITKEENMEIKINKPIDGSYVLNEFSAEIMREIENISKHFNYSSLRMMSSGGHDANNINKIAPSAMIFIPCLDGVSHSVKEFASKKDIEKGANVLLNTILKLAKGQVI